MENSSVVGWLFALLSYHSWVLFSSLTVTYVLYINTSTEGASIPRPFSHTPRIHTCISGEEPV